MRFVPEKIKTVCLELQNIAHRKLENIPLEFVPCNGYKSSNTPPETGWKPFQAGSTIRGGDAHYWFRCSFRTPQAVEGTQYYVKFICNWYYINLQGIVYANGRMVHGLDSNHDEVFLEADTDYILHNYVYLDLRDIATPLEASLCALDVRTENLYYDLQVALDCCMLQYPGSDEYITILTCLERTVNLLDLRDPGSAAYYESLEKASAFIHDEFYGKLCTPEGKPIVTCVGHTHIDVEWLWARAQTREKIQRSFATAASLMERYPEYKFMLSQPELYRYLKEEAPEKYEELKALVKEGRWEPEGAMYVESDCNLISGESLIRQILQGKKFFMDEFGVDCKILFLPDVFGYSAAMPQILKKSGIRHFVTSKISWNETNMMPVDCFLWKGIDGSEIFTNFLTTQNYTGPEAANNTTYGGILTPSQIKGTWNRFQQKAYVNRAMTTYGYGDGGGGPTRKMLETQRRLSKGIPGMPVTITDTLLNHLDKQREEFDRGCESNRRTPKWVGELYLEFHRGTYTSVARIKRNNRKSEWMLQLSEALSYTDLLHGGSYDGEGLYKKWTKVLHNQFHDIIPGSSIKEVYEGTDADYAGIRSYCEDLIRDKLSTLAASVAGEKGLLVYNPLGFERAGAITVDGRTLELSRNIPAFGWAVLDTPQAENTVSIQGFTAENAHYCLTLDRAGRIESLFDKDYGRSVLSAPGNELQIYEDFPREYDNWEISDYYKQKQWILDSDAIVEPITDGSRSGFRITKQYMRSRIVQDLWLYSESRRIDFETKIDWHEHHQILKAAFPLDILTNTATYEIQFGHVQRPTHENTFWDKAKFEVYGHKWADLSEPGYGVSLLNDCKYGHSAEGSTLKLTLLKCGTYPNPEADQGEHIFTYSLLPHSGGFREAGVIREAYSLNQPLLALEAKGGGTLPDTFSLVSCDAESVIVETVKKAEADSGMIVRLYEAFGGKCQANIRIAPGFRKAFLCDLMEKQLEELPIRDNTVTLPVHNFEIITLKFVC